MAITQAQWLQDFRDHLGDVNVNQKTDYQLILATIRAYQQAWPDWYKEIRDDATYTGYASLPAGTMSVPVPTSFVGGRIYNIFGRTNRYQQGVAFTAYGDSTSLNTWVLTSTAHNLSNNQQIQVDGGSFPTSLPVQLSNDTIYYANVSNSSSFTTAYTNTSTTFTTTGNHGWNVNQPVNLSGSYPGNLSNTVTYYILSVPTANTFTIGTTPAGPALPASGNGSMTTTFNGTLAFNIKTAALGSTLYYTASGSGYVGTYVVRANDYKPFNKWTRGIKLDPLTETSPRIRFTLRDNWPFEMRIEGAAQLVYPSVSIAVSPGSTFITPAGYTPIYDDRVYWAPPAPQGFTSGTGYYVINPTTTTFQLSLVSGGSASGTTGSGTFSFYPNSQTLTGTDYQWFVSFLRWQGEVFARTGLQRSGNLDRRAQAQRRLLAQQEAMNTRSHRMQPHESSIYSWDG